MDLSMLLRRPWHLSCLVLLFGAMLTVTFAKTQNDRAPAAKLAFRRGDHVSIVGNELAERLQHEGWLEAYLYDRLPKHDLVIRNLGFAGDELTARTRSANF